MAERRARRWLAFCAGAAAAVLLGVHFVGVGFGPFPLEWNIGLRQPIDGFQSWVIGNRSTHPIFILVFGPFSAFVDWGLRAAEDILLWLPWPVSVWLFAVLAWHAANWRITLLTVGGLFFMGLMGLWEQSMQTLALMLVAVSLSLLVSVPLGILAARHAHLQQVLRPILDLMQTMPAFVYLIPVLLFFGVARVPSVVATMIYAIPPGIRLTELGLRQVSPTVVEAARAFGATRRQLLWHVQLPLALPAIMAGVNQTIMMALSIVIIAALIGAGGLGREVLVALQRLQVGRALEAGLAVVMLAIIMDRISGALADQPTDLRAADANSEPSAQRPLWQRARIMVPLVAGLLLVACLLAGVQNFPAAVRVPLYQPVDAAVAWMRDNLYRIGDSGWGSGPLSDFITIRMLDPLRALFAHGLAWPVQVALVVCAGAALSGFPLALQAGLGLFAIGLLGMWELAMDTVSQVVVAVVISILMAVPLGIWAARNSLVDALLRPILDTLQTIPSFVFLVPVIMLFNVGRVPGVIASVLYALPPGIRLTTLGLRQVNDEVREAARAFGSSSWQQLTKVELPLALPSILLGINQVIMMVLAMVVISGLVGGAGLGLEAVIGLAKGQTGRGIEAGLAIAILAIIPDRMLQAAAQRMQPPV